MTEFVKIGRDIIIGNGLSAKHWAGAIIFGREAVYICLDASIKQVRQGIDSAFVAGSALGGAIGGAIAGAAGAKKGTPSWAEKVIELQELPNAVLNSAEWPSKKNHKKPVITVQRREVPQIRRRGGRLIFDALGDTFKLGMGLFGRTKTLQALRGLGWHIAE